MESKLRSVLRLLVKYDECVKALEENENAQNAIKDELKRLVAKRDSTQPRSFWVFAIIGVAFLVIGVFLGIEMLLAGFVFLIIAGFSYCRSAAKIEHPVEEYETTVYNPEMERLLSEAETLNAEKDSLWADFCEEASFLPIKYHDKFALAYMILSLKKGDATTLEEAMGLYGEEVFETDPDVLDRYCDRYVTMALE